jgi:hypothetical protein
LSIWLLLAAEAEDTVLRPGEALVAIDRRLSEKHLEEIALLNPPYVSNVWFPTLLPLVQVAPLATTLKQRTETTLYLRQSFQPEVVKVLVIVQHQDEKGAQVVVARLTIAL